MDKDYEFSYLDRTESFLQALGMGLLLAVVITLIVVSVYELALIVGSI